MAQVATLDLYMEVLRRVSDPGSVLPRGDNYDEPITSWSTRAVMALFTDADLTLANVDLTGAALDAKVPVSHRCAQLIKQSSQR